MRSIRQIGLVAVFAVALTLTARSASAAEPKVGDAAPDFTLKGSDGKTYKLSDFKGKQAVVVAWFPKAFTGGCTAAGQSLGANTDKIRKYDVSFFMASVDQVEGEKGNKAFAESEHASFPILSDPDKKVAGEYGVMSERGFANRWTFYIDKDGKIAAIDKKVQPKTSAEDMLAKLEELKVAKK